MYLLERDGEDTGKESREERVYLERLFSFFFFSRVYFELEVYTLSGVYLIIFLFSYFRIFTSFIVVCSLSLSWLLGIDEFRKSLLFSKLVDARYREVLSRDIPVSSCCKLMM